MASLKAMDSMHVLHIDEQISPASPDSGFELTPPNSLGGFADQHIANWMMLRLPS